MSNSDEPSSSAAAAGREMDPLLKDLKEEKQSFRRNLASLLTELKEVRSRLAFLEKSFAREASARQEAEAMAKRTEEELCRLQECLEERDMQLKASVSSAEKELYDLRTQLLAAQAAANASSASAQSARLQCSELLKELEEKNRLLAEYENLIGRLRKLMDILHEGGFPSTSRTTARKCPKDEVLRIEDGIMQAIGRAGQGSGDCEMSNASLDEFCRGDYSFKATASVVMAKLGDETRVMSEEWKRNSSRDDTNGGRCKMMAWKCYWACTLLWRLVSLLVSLQVLGFRLILYLSIQAMQLLLKLIFVEPLRICLFVVRTLCTQNLFYFRFSVVR